METMDTLVKAFMSACGAGLLTLIVFCIKWLVQIIKRDRITLDSLTQDAYFRDCKHLLEEDVISKDELRNHQWLYKAYRLRGFNGTGEKIHQLILEKPVRMD